MKESQALSPKLTSDSPVLPKKCPVCGIYTNYVNRLTHEGETTDWYRCNCGVIFQGEDPDYSVYNQEYLDALVADKKYDARAGYYSYVYGPIIEEETLGRKMLDVGCGIKSNMEHWKERGWLTWGVDFNKDISPDKDIAKEDFLTFDPSKKLNTPEILSLAGVDRIEMKYDLIWMNQTFSCFKNPRLALARCKDLLNDSGVLFISVPDIDFITRVGLNGWPHWRSHEYKVLWSVTALKRELEKSGFSVALSRRNYAPRFSKWHDLHIIATKPYF